MKITAISDLHGKHPKLDGGDLLLIAGDITARDKVSEWYLFNDWLQQQDYRKKIVIAGNHDGCIENSMASQRFFNGACYLQDSMEEFEGFKIWGSPWTPTFCDWHFMKSRGLEIKERWDLIPDDIDILVTHGPPYGILDLVDNAYESDKHRGCIDLRHAVERIKPKLHVFGHIHEGYGQLLYKHEGPNTLCVNASIMDENYNPTNKPVSIEL